MKTLVTGANGFVGKALCQRLTREGHELVATSQNSSPSQPWVTATGPMDGCTDWRKLLEGCDNVVHLAARVHIMQQDDMESLKSYRTTNVDATQALAKQAAAAGVKRFVFLSSAKVFGECGHFSQSDPYQPQDQYSRSKVEAEKSLAALRASSSLETVVLQPPLVYGPGVKANFLRLMQWIDRGFPLPLGGIHNVRSMIYVGNLVDAISTCLVHPQAAGETFLVSDREQLSTAETIQLLAQALQRPARLFDCPETLLHLGGKLLGRATEIDRLTNSLCVDTRHIQRRLGWTPPYSAQDGFESTARWYRSFTHA